MYEALSGLPAAPTDPDTLVAKPPPPPNFAQQPMSSILKAGLPQQPRPPTLTPIRYSAAAAGATQHANNTAPHPTTTTTTTTSATNPTPIVTNILSQPPAPSTATTSIVTTPPTQDQLSRVSSSPSLTHPSVTSPMLSSASAANLDESLYSVDDSPSPMVSEDQANAATSSPHVDPRIGKSPPLCFHSRNSPFLHSWLYGDTTRSTAFTQAECESSLSRRVALVMVPGANR